MKFLTKKESDFFGLEKLLTVENCNFFPNTVQCIFVVNTVKFKSFLNILYINATFF